MFRSRNLIRGDRGFSAVPFVCVVFYFLHFLHFLHFLQFAFFVFADIKFGELQKHHFCGTSAQPYQLSSTDTLNKTN